MAILRFQLFFSFLIFIVLIRLFVQFYKKRINSFYFLFFITVWWLIFFFNWNTPILNRLGHFLGIERGATILIYVGLLSLFYYVFVSLVRFYKLEQDISKLTKKDAVNDFFMRYNKK